MNVPLSCIFGYVDNEGVAVTAPLKAAMVIITSNMIQIFILGHAFNIIL